MARLVLTFERGPNEAIMRDIGHESARFLGYLQLQVGTQTYALPVQATPLNRPDMVLPPPQPRLSWFAQDASPAPIGGGNLIAIVLRYFYRSPICPTDDQNSRQNRKADRAV